MASFLWACCSCDQDGMLANFSKACTNCGHGVCEGCRHYISSSYVLGEKERLLLENLHQESGRRSNDDNCEMGDSEFADVESGAGVSEPSADSGSTWWHQGKRPEHLRRRKPAPRSPSHATSSTQSGSGNYFSPRPPINALGGYGGYRPGYLPPFAAQPLAPFGAPPSGGPYGYEYQDPRLLAHYPGYAIIKALEPPKIDPETEKKLAAQQEDIEKQQKNLTEMKAKEAETLVKVAELTNLIKESRAREQKIKDNTEWAAEMRKRIGEELTKAEVKEVAAQARKEIAHNQARYDAEVAASSAARAKAEMEAAERVAKEKYVKAIQDAADAEEAAKARANMEATVAGEEAEAKKGKRAARRLDKQKPIRFKDALGRKFNFPFELCATWKGMHDLICEAFAHVEPISAMVQEGNFDLIGPDGEIILPQMWETVIEPDWTVSMHMWPIKEAPRYEQGVPGMTHRKGKERAIIPGGLGLGWMGRLSNGNSGPLGVDVLPEKPKREKKQQTSGWVSLFGAAPKKAGKRKRDADILEERRSDGYDGQNDSEGYLSVHQYRVTGLEAGGTALDEGAEAQVDAGEGDEEAAGTSANIDVNVDQILVPPTAIPLPDSPPPTPLLSGRNNTAKETVEVLEALISLDSPPATPPSASTPNIPVALSQPLTPAVSEESTPTHTSPTASSDPLAAFPPRKSSSSAAAATPEARSLHTEASSHWYNNVSTIVGTPSTSERSTSSVERSPMLVIWTVVTCVTIGTISLVILTFGTTTALIDEKTSSAEPSSHPSISDSEFSLTIQACGWQITNLIAGLIPACMHANRYRKWLRMNYAWLPAIVCFAMVVASIPVYLQSPAMSNGLAGIANIPMGLFIFFATYEALREEKHMKCCHSAGSGPSRRDDESMKGRVESIEMQRIQ